MPQPPRPNEHNPPHTAEQSHPEAAAPPAIVRKRVILVGTAFVLSLVAGAGAGRLGMGFIAEVGIFVGVLAAVGAYLLIAERRLRERLRAADWRLCTRCTFDLSSLPEEGECPECGQRYHHFDCRMQWKLVPLLGGKRTGSGES